MKTLFNKSKGFLFTGLQLQNCTHSDVLHPNDVFASAESIAGSSSMIDIDIEVLSVHTQLAGLTLSSLAELLGGLGHCTQSCIMLCSSLSLSNGSGVL